MSDFIRALRSFWSLLPAITAYLAPKDDIPKALSIMYLGVSVSTILSLPVASFMGEIWGWRAVYIGMALLGVISLAWQLISLPKMAPIPGASFRNMFNLLKTPWVFLGLAMTFFVYAGYYSFFTYLRAYLEHDMGLGVLNITLILFIFGVANCVSTAFAGKILARNFNKFMSLVFVGFIVLALLLLVFTNFKASFGVQILVVLWGVLFGFVSIGWSVWTMVELPSKAELVGGLGVAFIQGAMGFSAFVGGELYDKSGINSLFIASIVFMILGMLSLRRSYELKP